MNEDLAKYFLRDDVSWQDKCYQAIEEMSGVDMISLAEYCINHLESQRAIHRLAECCIEHLEEEKELKTLSDCIILKRVSPNAQGMGYQSVPQADPENIQCLKDTCTSSI